MSLFLTLSLSYYFHLKLYLLWNPIWIAFDLQICEFVTNRFQFKHPHHPLNVVPLMAYIHWISTNKQINFQPPLEHKSSDRLWLWHFAFYSAQNQYPPTVKLPIELVGDTIGTRFPKLYSFAGGCEALKAWHSCVDSVLNLPPKICIQLYSFPSSPAAATVDDSICSKYRAWVVLLRIFECVAWIVCIWICEILWIRLVHCLFFFAACSFSTSTVRANVHAAYSHTDPEGSWWQRVSRRWSGPCHYVGHADILTSLKRKFSSELPNAKVSGSFPSLRRCGCCYNAVQWCLLLTEYPH